MVNLIGSWHPERTQRVVIGAHYDTRPHPDEERTPTGSNSRSWAPNDGASGVAMLMEIAHHLNDLNTPWGVDLVIFDGEELVYGRISIPRVSISWAPRSLPGLTWRCRGGRENRYAAGIVLDMIGGRKLTDQPGAQQPEPGSQSCS